MTQMSITEWSVGVVLNIKSIANDEALFIERRILTGYYKAFILTFKEPVLS